VALAGAWLICSSALAQTSLLAAGSAERGAALVAEKGCGGCHTIPGVARADGLVGPPLMQMGQRIFIAGMLRNTPANLATWVLDPQRFAPGNAMPSTGLTPQEAADVAAFLESLR
jgi:cytochrome c1